MAVQKKDSSSTTAKKTRTTTKKVEETKEENIYNAETFDILMKKIAELEDKLSNANNSAERDNFYSGKKIRCINLMHNPVNVSTEEDGMGKVFSFNKYGDSLLIKYDDLSNIVNNYPNTMENGLIYITDKRAVRELGLEEDYENIYDKDTLDRIVKLRSEADVELLLGIKNENLLESTIRDVCERISMNESYDLNYIGRISKETGYDIMKMAEEMKVVKK